MKFCGSQYSFCEGTASSLGLTGSLQALCWHTNPLSVGYWKTICIFVPSLPWWKKLSSTYDKSSVCRKAVT